MEGKNQLSESLVFELKTQQVDLEFVSSLGMENKIRYKIICFEESMESSFPFCFVLLVSSISRSKLQCRPSSLEDYDHT